MIGGTLKGLEEVPVTFTSSNGQKLIAIGTPWDNSNMTVIVPEEVPLGPTGISVTLDGQEIGAAVDIVIVEYAPALFSMDGDPYGPIKAANYYEDGAVLNGLTRPAVPSQVVWIWSTGLNGAGIDDVTLWVADDPVVPEYVGPSGFTGIEQINFRVPPSPKLGCYVPIAIEVRHVRSDNLVVSINGQPGACAHPLGLSYPELIALDKAAGTNELTGVRMGVLRLEDQYNDLGSDESFLGGFGRVSRQTVFQYSGAQLPPSMSYGCRPLDPSDSAHFSNLEIPLGLDAGGTTNLYGPGGRVNLTTRLTNNGKDPLGFQIETRGPIPDFLPGGDWLLELTGGADVPPLQQAFHLPPPPMWETPLDETIHLSRNRDNVVRWDPTGYAPGEWMLIGVDSLGCFIPADWGRILIPGNLLGPRTNPGMWMRVFPASGWPKAFPVELVDGQTIRALIYYVRFGPDRDAVVE